MKSRKFFSLLMALVMLFSLTLTTPVSADASLAIKTQPVDAEGKLNTTVSFSVEAEGGTEPYTYQWQFKKASASSWSNASATGAKTDTMSASITASRMENEYRCKITDADGTIVYSDSVRMTVPAGEPLEIKTQPTDAEGKLNDNVSFTVEAKGGKTPYSYQWQFKKDGSSSWSNASATGAKTDTMTASITSSRMQNEYRCKITDANGDVVYSDGARMKLAASMVIKTQPVDAEGKLNDTVSFTVAVEGGVEPYTYQWQFQKDGTTTWSTASATGAKTATMSAAITASRMQNAYRCKITDADGNIIYSDSARMMLSSAATLAVKTQPADAEAELNDPISFTVEVEGGKEPYTYQWQFSKNDGSSWSSSSMTGNKTATMTGTATTTRMAYLFRCKITDADGTIVYTDAVKIVEPAAGLAIKTQPVDAEGQLNDPVTFTVEVEGGKEPYTYQWKFRKAGTTNAFSSASMTGAKTATMSGTITTNRLVYEYVCFITDANGKTITSDPVCMKIAAGTPLAVKTQPVDVEGQLNDTVSFTVAVEGGVAPYTYQWQFQKDGTTTWSTVSMTGNKTATVTGTISTSRMKNAYRCQITDAEGTVIYSDSVRMLLAAAPLAITTQPVSVEGKLNDSVSFTVAVEGGVEPYTYQWKFRKAGTANAFSNAGMTGNKTATMTGTITETRTTYEYVCVITDAAGNTITSDPVQMILSADIVIDDVVYKLSEDGTTAYVAEYNGSASSLVIPAAVEGKPVTMIGESAFEGNSTLTSIDLPDCIEVIGKRAFANCSKLKEMK